MTPKSLFSALITEGCLEIRQAPTELQLDFNFLALSDKNYNYNDLIIIVMTNWVLAV